MNTNTNTSTTPPIDGLDAQQRAMGLAGQFAAALDEPYAGDAQQLAMGSAGQNLLINAQRESQGTDVRADSPLATSGALANAGA